MAANAVRNAAERAGLGPNDVELLTAATTCRTCWLSRACQHGARLSWAMGRSRLRLAHGICSSGMMALKNAYLQVAIGEKRNAICVASEFAITRVQEHPLRRDGADLDEDGSLPMETAFLRYMLSDGAGAAVVENAPAASGISLRIDWISLTSFANTEKACMYVGSNDNACPKTWGTIRPPRQPRPTVRSLLRQDLSLLPHLISVGIDEYERLRAMGKFDPKR